MNPRLKAILEHVNAAAFESQELAKELIGVNNERAQRGVQMAREFEEKVDAINNFDRQLAKDAKDAQDKKDAAAAALAAATANAPK